MNIFDKKTFNIRFRQAPKERRDKLVCTMSTKYIMLLKTKRDFQIQDTQISTWVDGCGPLKNNESLQRKEQAFIF
jgi:hypothetical protein